VYSVLCRLHKFLSNSWNPVGTVGNSAFPLGRSFQSELRSRCQKSKGTEFPCVPAEIKPCLNYSTPMASRTSSPLPRDKNKSDMTHFNGPIVKCSESEAVSTSTGLVASVTWPDLRYPCSLAGKNSSATVAQHLDGNRLRVTGIALKCMLQTHSKWWCACVNIVPYVCWGPHWYKTVSIFRKKM